MRACQSVLAIILLIAIPCLIFGQSGTTSSKNEPRVAASSKAVQKKPELAPNKATVIPASHTIPRTMFEIEKTHPDQIESDLNSIAERLSAAGLIDESRQVKELLQRIQEEHREQLLAAHKKAVANAWEPQVALSVKWYDINADPATTDEVMELLRIDPAKTRLPDDPKSPPATLSGAVAHRDAVELIDKLVDQGQAGLVIEQHINLRNGREGRFVHGTAIDVSESAYSGKLIQLATTENGSFPKPDVDVLSRPKVALLGTSICAIAEVRDEMQVKLSVITQHSTLAPKQPKASYPNLETQRIQTVLEIDDGQSMVLFGLESSRNVTEVTRIPVLGDIPGVGTRLFSSKKMRNEQHQMLCVMTPKIVKPTDVSTGNSFWQAMQPPLSADTKKAQKPEPVENGFGTGSRPTGTR